jgi:translation initiation factor IF-2
LQSVTRTAAQAAPLIEIPAGVTVADLSELMDVDPIETIKQLMRSGFMLSMNDEIEFETAAMVAQSLGLRVRAPRKEDRGPGSLTVSHEGERESDLVPRSPVITILGHVDHGKTTLLDRIRSSNVTASEAGGITQHIGAYQIQRDDERITFLDTPGHEAFTAMRARGAQVTDIAVIVVAADDGIMPQTVEAIDHARAADVPLVVAINKVDSPRADTERVKRQLAENDLLIEEWGGDVVAVPVSALTGDGIDNLLDNLSVVAEVAELKANPTRPARGVVVEAQIDRSRGPIATLLVQTGTLRVGDLLVAGEVYGRVRAMRDDRGNTVQEAGPAVPIEVMGLSGLPQAGDIAEVAESDRSARTATEKQRQSREDKKRSGITLAEVHSMMESGDAETLDLIVKTDVQGSIDAVRNALQALSTGTTRVNIIHAQTGTISESDIMLAAASNAIIVGFNVKPETGAQTLAAHEDVEIRTYDIIYNLVDDISKALSGLLAPETRDVVEGFGTVRAVFGVGGRRLAAGFYVNQGRISRSGTIHVLRGGSKLFEGTAASLRHFRDDVREVSTGLEGGLVLDGFSEFQEGDLIESHRIEEV